MITNGQFVKKFKDKNLNKLNEKTLNLILKNSYEILKKINFKINEQKIINPVGLIIGKIQSGKTINFLSLISILFDNDYDIVIVFGGTDGVILDQNKDRLLKLFSDDKKTSFVNLKIDKDFTKYEKLITIKNKKIIIPCLKNMNHLKWLTSFFEKSSVFKNKKVVIIDDEGDSYTPDGNKNVNSKEQPTKIFKMVKNIRENILNDHIFLSITATAQLNLSLLRDQGDHLKPDFYHLINPGEEYTGLQTFHSNNKYLEIVENPEDNAYIIDALYYFLVVSTKFAIDKKDEDAVCTMLVHTDHKTIQHQKINEILKEEKDKIVQKLEIEDNYDFSRKELIDKINRSFEIIFKRKLDFKNNNDLNFLKIFKDRIAFTITKIINNKSDSKTFNDTDDLNTIVIGANLLQRGVTIKGLLTVYMTRRAKKISSADTTLQRARWFGYRTEVLEYLKIFLSKEIANDYYKLASDEENRWNILVQNDSYLKNKESYEKLIREYKMQLSKSDNLIPHRKNAGNFKYEKSNLNKWIWQDEFSKDGQFEKRDITNILSSSNSEKRNYTDNIIHKESTFKNCSEFKNKYPALINSIFKKINLDENSKQNLLKSDKQLKVIKIRHNSTVDNFRTIKNGKISLQSGRGAKDGGYIGDNKLHECLWNTNKNLILIYELYIKDLDGNKTHDKSYYYGIYNFTENQNNETWVIK